MATFNGTKYNCSIILRLDIVATRIQWPERDGPRWPLYPKCTVFDIIIKQEYCILQHYSLYFQARKEGIAVKM